MTVERKRTMSEWGVGIDRRMTTPPKVSKKVMAAEMGIVPSTFYSWLCKPDLDEKTKTSVEEALTFFKLGGKPETSLQTVDRPVDRNTKVGEGEVLRTICTILRASGACRGLVTMEAALDLLRGTDELQELVDQEVKRGGLG